MSRMRLTLCLAAILNLLEIGSCLRCYQCNSQIDPTCKDPFSGYNNVVDCSTTDSVNYSRLNLRNVLPLESIEDVFGSPRHCHKIVMHDGVTIRTCLNVNPLYPSQTCIFLEKSLVQAGPSKQIKSCSVCGRDLCNGETSLTS